MPPASQRAPVAPDPAVFLSPAPEEAAKVVERTSLAGRHYAPDEVTVRFLKWHPHGNTAYQRGQFAGFQRNVAMRLIAIGAAIVAETPQQRRDVADRVMVTK